MAGDMTVDEYPDGTPGPHAKRHCNQLPDTGPVPADQGRA
jgi:hypothetical protein